MKTLELVYAIKNYWHYLLGKNSIDCRPPHVNVFGEPTSYHMPYISLGHVINGRWLQGYVELNYLHLHSF